MSAIVRASGDKKSTIASRILRFYDMDEGAVLVAVLVASMPKSLGVISF